MITKQKELTKSLLLRVREYNPVCFYSFYYAAISEINLNNYDLAVDYLQNAIRIYYSSRKNQKENLTLQIKQDYPILSEKLLNIVLSKVPSNKGNEITKLHPIHSGAIMWLHLCNCYLNQANFEGAYNCVNKSLDDYCKYVGPATILDQSKELPKTNFSQILEKIIDLNKSQNHYVSVLKYQLLNDYLISDPNNAKDIMTLCYNLAKCSYHLSLFKETLVFSELGLKCISILSTKESIFLNEII